MKNFKVTITGSGTKQEIVDTLKKLAKIIEVSSEEDLDDGEIEEPTLLMSTQLEE